MSSLFSHTMEKDGDLADIVLLASGGGGGGSSGGAVGHSGNQLHWSSPDEVVSFPPPDNFGNPFSNMQDPLHEPAIPSPGFFNASDEYASTPNNTALLPTAVFDEDLRPPSNNIFSRMLQISPNNTISGSLAKGLCCSVDEKITSNTSAGSSMESIGMVQISSSRNLGIKRRKNQAKKVVCIPAPAAATSSRPSGEVVPSDLWAWRKYGQKPIKGSPYPRGYYRCSSSKGCLARKQVERSRTDPNMLVITYSSEHNHPWPTQRNALAGSTRSQPSKSSAASKTATSQTSLMNMEEHKETVSEGTSSSVKEELGDVDGDHVHDQPFHIDGNLQPSDDLFFADLEELEYDPLNLMVSTNDLNGEETQEGRENKGLDPFSLFDWAGNNMFEENKKGGL